MNTPVRFGVSLVLGLLAAVGLFLLMNFLVSRGEAGIEAQRREPLPQFIRMDDQEQIVRRREREKPEPPEEIKPIPRLEAVATPKQPTPQPPAFDLPRFDFPTDLALAGLPLAAPPPAPTGPVAYTQSLTPISQVPPQYPVRARRQGISGWVRLEFVVNPDGSVRDVSVVEAEPREGIFDQEAVRALSRWRFHPQMQDGKAVPAIATITIVFNLEG
ncbi:energy transducer TonB [Desulfonatronum thiodismutans]|uniref:energy transducer TonB n=1 Tax=Desulfonatronum thiodismutans TaxID=159290 RepID=UPI0004ABD4D6|nr:energy transducer TonB [Desulfonatronum thiodismutans]